jgi:plastocyanin
MLARRTAAPLILTMLALPFALAACGADDARAPGASRGTAITIKQFTFAPTPLKAKVGDTITVANHDETRHTATANDGSFNTGDLAGNATGTIKLTKAGSVAYHCAIHDYMHGVIQISA